MNTMLLNYYCAILILWNYHWIFLMKNVKHPCTARHDFTFDQLPLREQVSLLNIVCCAHLLSRFTSLFGDNAIAAVILMQLHVSTFHFGNPYSVRVKYFSQLSNACPTMLMLVNIVFWIHFRWLYEFRK